MVIATSEMATVGYQPSACGSIVPVGTVWVQLGNDKAEG
jgi:hypothetical protein